MLNLHDSEVVVMPDILLSSSAAKARILQSPDDRYAVALSSLVVAPIYPSNPPVRLFGRLCLLLRYGKRAGTDIKGLISFCALCALYGVYFTLFCLALWAAYQKKERAYKRLRCISVILFVDVTLHLSGQAVLFARARVVPGPADERDKSIVPMSVLQGLTTTVAGLLSDSLLAWRFYIIFDRPWARFVPAGLIIINTLLALSANFLPLTVYYNADLYESRLRRSSLVILATWGWFMVVMHTVLTISIIAQILYVPGIGYFISRPSSLPLMRVSRRPMKLSSGDTATQSKYNDILRAFTESFLVTWIGLLMYEIASFAPSGGITTNIDVGYVMGTILPVFFGLSQCLITARLGLTNISKQNHADTSCLVKRTTLNRNRVADSLRKEEHADWNDGKILEKVLEKYMSNASIWTCVLGIHAILVIWLTLPYVVNGCTNTENIHMGTWFLSVFVWWSTSHREGLKATDKFPGSSYSPFVPLPSSCHLLNVMERQRSERYETTSSGYSGDVGTTSLLVIIRRLWVLMRLCPPRFIDLTAHFIGQIAEFMPARNAWFVDDLLEWSTPIIILEGLTTAIAGLLIDSLLIWRAYAVWEKRKCIQHGFVFLTTINFCLALAATFIPLVIYQDAIHCANKIRYLSAMLMAIWGWIMLTMHVVLTWCIFIRILFPGSVYGGRNSARSRQKFMSILRAIVESSAITWIALFAYEMASFIPKGRITPELDIGFVMRRILPIFFGISQCVLTVRTGFARVFPPRHGTESRGESAHFAIAGERFELTTFGGTDLTQVVLQQDAVMQSVYDGVVRQASGIRPRSDLRSLKSTGPTFCAHCYTQHLHPLTMSTGIVRRRGSIDVVDAKVAVDLATAQSYKENVFLFVPNLIGYSRIILAGLALHFMSYHPKYCTIAYCISCLLDAADGHAARALGQASKFGAVLDMVTDRCTTSALLCYLSSAYPNYTMVFQILITIDFASHYMHMYSSLVTGSRSHKAVRSEVSWFMSVYYRPTVLFLACAGNELFYVALYLAKWVHTPLYQSLDVTPSFFTYFTWAEALAYICSPIWAYKNVINLIQLWKASKILVGVDLADRAKARQEQEQEPQEKKR
ncbi:hypothetical protein NM688_g408 [Phlebia brevispora]|uniref:Uncharacterized protein n=1 Tax=Phlebia brevispora TaxID=194682 RepID=A0ACC1TF72_9APHY|nr:hypothetical protein NM688_g408 [Phlebia brevispora]